MIYPNLKQVESASQELLCRWYRFLPSPTVPEQGEILSRIIKRWNDGGGFTAELSKRVGWARKKA